MPTSWKPLSVNKLNQRGVVHLLVPLILIIGIIAGVYLVSHPQIFKPKASSDNIEWVSSSGDPENCVTGSGTTTCPKVKFRINVPVQVPQ